MEVYTFILKEQGYFRGGLVLKSTLLFKKAPNIEEKGPFCNLKV